MFRNRLILALAFPLCLCSCQNSSSQSTPEDGRKLNAASKIAEEIKKVHSINCNPFLRTEDGVAQIEFDDIDPNSNYESIIPKISELQSVQSFDGKLQLLFRIRGETSQTETVARVARFDAKTGQQITKP